MKNSHNSHRTETASENYSGSTCKIASKLKKKISSLKRKLKKTKKALAKAEKAIEKVRINKRAIHANNKLYSDNVRGLYRTSKKQYTELRDSIQHLKKDIDNKKITVPIKVQLQFSIPNNST
jgi:chromosome segregation ATPase